MRKIFHFSFLIGLMASFIVSTAYMPHARAEAITHDLDLPAGWSMISLPVRPSNRTLSSLFPEAVVVYGYEGGAGYVRVTGEQELEVGKGYWILLDQNQTYTLNGESIQEYTLGVEDRWYMIGGCSSEAEVSIDNGNIAVIYRYVQGVGYQRVLESEHIEPGVGYWILLANTNNQAQLKVDGGGGVLTCTDEDNDGYAIQGGSCGPIDCDDTDRDIYLGALEICGDGIDQDCNGEDLACIVPTQPPNPADVAPEVDQTVATTMDAATRFLYTGSNPIQRGMAHGTLEPTRVAVLRGKVLTGNGDHLPGVQITILNHPEYGETLSREDGMFDMVVNGGGFLTINYAKEAYPSAQRQINVPWQDYAWLPDVALVQLDSKVTMVDFSEPMQVARGNPVTDADGSRQATLLFSQGTTAEMVLPDGSTQPLASLSVRATEYSVGENGQKAMPAELPPTSAYTYCVEFTADEALAAGATDVLFDQPVYTYVEDFIGCPVGSAVPTGYYDRQKGRWLASENGRVIKVLSITSGLADLDTDGDEVVDDSATLAALGIKDTERQRLAALYAPDQSLWRVPVNHFTPYDCNWPYGPPMDAKYPNQPQPHPWDPEDDPCENSGSSIIECQNQILGERVPLTGTSFTVNYRSDRVPGHRASYTLEIPLSGDSIPGSLVRIHLEIKVAGRKFSETFYPAPNLSYTFTWDGKDAYGRSLQGKQPISVRIGYEYTPVYYPVREDFERSFARVQGRSGSGVMDVIGAPRRAVRFILWQDWKGLIGAWDAQVQDLGGWTLNMHHAYDPIGCILYQGDGRKRSIQNINTDYVIDTIAGTGTMGDSGNDGPATKAELRSPSGIAVAPDGSFYIATNWRLRRVGPDGIITTTDFFYYPRYINDVDLAPDGSVYIAETGGNRIVLGGSGVFKKVIAGTGTSGYSGDGGLATEAKLSSPHGIAVGPDGSLYIADTSNNRIRRVGLDGAITTVAGNGTFGYSGDGGLATEARLASPHDITTTSDGRLYIADFNNHRIRLVTPDGIITTVAGTGASGYSGDNGPASEAKLRFPTGLAVDASGNLYISMEHCIRKVDVQGMITTLAGSETSGYNGDGGPGTEARLNKPQDVVLIPNGNLYIADEGNHRIRQISSVFPVFSLADIILPSENGNEIYHFNSVGRHLRTLNALTGAVIYRFTYDATGFLTAVEDSDENVTTIERDSAGNPIAIVAPFGQRTTLTLNTNGYLASITDPAVEANRFEYTTGGLLTKMTDPRNNTYNYTYDDLGLLIKAEDPAGGYKELARTKLERTKTITEGHEVTLTTAMGRTTTYRVEQLSTGEKRLVNTLGCCGSIEVLIGTDGSRTINYADGTVITQVDYPDPRWGMLAPLQNRTITTPGGLHFVTEQTRSVTLMDPTDLLSLNYLTDIITTNGRTFSSSYVAATRTTTSTSYAGRQIKTVSDDFGREIQIEAPELVPVNSTYDNRGRLSSVSQGLGTDERVVAFTYGASGYLETITNPLGWDARFENDLAGRIVSKIFPDGREVLFSYDANGNLVSVTPPGRTVHMFNYNSVDLTEEYNPPDVGAGTNNTVYSYNLDKQPAKTTRPDGQTIDFSYDAAGRLGMIKIPEGDYAYSYDVTSGKLTQATAPDGGTLSFAYDGALLTQTTLSGSVSGNVGFDYDNDFRLTSVSINGADTVDYVYDADGLMVQAGDLILTRNNENGLLTGTLINMVSGSLVYNGFGEVDSYAEQFDVNPLVAVNYTYDKLDRIIKIIETVSGVSKTYEYGYDPGGRLVEVKLDGMTISLYGYDANGNRMSRTQGLDTTTGTYDDQDRLLRYGNTTYTYTPNGELLTKTKNGQTTRYDYDVLGNLRSVELPNGNIIEYLIDAANRRIGKKVNGMLVQGFLYMDALKPIAELDGVNNVISRFVYATGINVPDYMVRGGAIYRIITDHLGSPRMVVNVVDGTVAQKMDYDEFGNVVIDTNPGFQPFGFGGGLYDNDTGLVRFGTRDYEASTGRWTSKDPTMSSVSDVNFYVYGGNDPLNRLDPFGLKPQLNLFHKEDRLRLVADQIPSEEGVFIIVGHGSSFEVEDENKNYLNAEDLWKRIKFHHAFKRDNCKIKLLACLTGKGKNSIAEQLSRLSDCKVFAPVKTMEYIYIEENNMLIEYGVKVKGKKGLHLKLREFPLKTGKK